ncbi:unnamed protein product [Paramecium sonneborni]|uniref:Glutathione peroxidase n=1 Tax=Paramecium sonneborni TaxID=65129 RepID=A0A8S1QZ89_9CILI|nr:unnamed protein product [Paramecium sonneborni]
MGNSGIRKLWFLDSPVETPYKSIYEIDVININKSEESLSQYKGQKIIIVNVAIDSPELNDQLNYLKSLPYQVLLFPKYDNKYTYQQIANKLQGFKVFQKVELNGQYTHPLYKFLKRQTPQLYDEKLANGRQIKQDFCKFLISEEGQPIKYLLQNEKL